MTAVRLRRVAERLGMSLEGLANFLGIGRRTIYDWVEQDRVPDAVAMLLEVMVKHKFSPAYVQRLAEIPVNSPQSNR